MKKQCLHKFHSVYYGSEWEVECRKCDKNVRDLYNKEDSNKIVDDLLLIANNQKYNYHTFGTAQESIDEQRYWNPKTKDEENVEIGIFLFIIILIIICIVWKVLK